MHSMRKLLGHTLLALLLVIAVSTVGKASETPPCEDKLFLQLKAKPLDSLSVREFEYLKMMSSRCDTYTRLMLQATGEAKPDLTKAEEQPRPPMGTGTLVAMSVLTTIVALLVIGAIASSGE